MIDMLGHIPVKHAEKNVYIAVDRVFSLIALKFLSLFNIYLKFILKKSS
jgi:hypothetical protein